MQHYLVSISRDNACYPFGAKPLPENKLTYIEIAIKIQGICFKKII